MPFGIVSAPEVFQKRNQKLFGNIEGVEIYFDDIIAAGCDEDSHDAIMSRVLERVKLLNIKFNPDKLQYRLVQEPARNINQGYRWKEGLWATHRYPNVRRRASETVSGTSQSRRREELFCCRQLIVSAFNAQSLVAHAGDIESDNILMNSDYMVISQTSTNCANTVMINGFELRASNNTALEHRTHCPSTSSELPVRVSAAGGSAIYRNLQSSTNCSEIIVNANKSCGNSVLRKHNVGDICLVDV
ncbi:reverse transcriptase domain-containing protein [Trichonephila clavipes]|uniref:Reverse transcriptase domain-containing protein n=1 Tax=Trichonephila clavipes TaxID=2585209 RepID=A0A8X6WH57_TRICX|nr:reverse transcriptase domain-containing protein [Trichonephila clavipes]